MMIATVVPLRRLPLGVDRLRYISPAPDLRVGQVVMVPMQKVTIPAVVWETGQSNGAPEDLRSVLGLADQFSIVTAWQRNCIEHFCVRYHFSRASFLSTHVPNPVTGAEAGDRTSASSADTKRIWYDRRPMAMDEIVKWLQVDGLRLVIVPTVNDLQEIHARYPSGTIVHGRLTKKQFQRVYRSVLDGTTTKIIGTAKALFLPYPSAPRIMVDQEEHRQYAFTEQRPHYDLVPFLRSQDIDFSFTTPAPRVMTWQDHKGLLAPASQEGRGLGTLGVPGHDPFVSPELSIRMDTADLKSIAFIVPRSGYSSLLICRQCKFVVRCQSCHQAVRIVRHDATHTRCQSCHQLQILPTTCPQCQGFSWKFTGVGAEQWRTIVKKMDWRASRTAQVRIGTYRLLNELSSLPRPRLVVMTQADALLNYGDFAAEEIGWQFLSRLQAQLELGEYILAQTYEPGRPFWQQWLGGDQAAFYKRVLAERAQYNLPPTVEQWVVTIPKLSREAAEKELRRCLPLDQDVKITELPTHADDGTRFVLSSAASRPISTVLSIDIFPSEWLVDRDVNTWLS